MKRKMTGREEQERQLRGKDPNPFTTKLMINQMMRIEWRLAVQDSMVRMLRCKYNTVQWLFS